MSACAAIAMRAQTHSCYRRRCNASELLLLGMSAPADCPTADEALRLLTAYMAGLGGLVGLGWGVQTQHSCLAVSHACHQLAGLMQADFSCPEC